MMTSRWKLDRKRLIRSKRNFADKMLKLDLHNADGSQPEVLCSPKNRNYHDWLKWIDVHGIQPPRHRPWGVESIEEREGFYSDPWLSSSGRAVYVTSKIEDDFLDDLT